ncbi:MAG: hypothetical protein RLZZ536_2928, partial [Planctomycetota bacterium]
ALWLPLSLRLPQKVLLLYARTKVSMGQNSDPQNRQQQSREERPDHFGH